MVRDVQLIRSPLSVVGILLTTVSAVLFLAVFVADLFGLHTNPYIGVLFFLILPAIFLVGLLLVPLGAWLERRRRRAGLSPAAMRWPRVDLNDPTHRRAVFIAFILTIANVVIVSLGAYRGVEYMDSVSFCGQVCHTAMKPEFVAHAYQPHAQVKCVDCHVGSGATSFAKAKLAGTRRVLAVTLGSYPRPIVAAPEQLVSSDDTCQQCHWPQKLHGDTIRRLVEYGNDEQNTESVTTIRVHVGGGDPRRGTVSGVHWHMNLASEIEYVASDRDRQVIPYVKMTDQAGTVREYFAEGVTPEQIAKGKARRFECTDCHNRPSHAIAATPERAVNDAMARGEIPRTLPFIHREAVKVLKVEHASADAAGAAISRALREFYGTANPPVVASQRRDVDQAVLAVQELYRRNVFPDMKIRFGTQPNNIGHVDFPGCFRCHDDSHTAKDGRKIGQDCETCHSIE